jgi:hypothetical protein
LSDVPIEVRSNASCAKRVKPAASIATRPFQALVRD